MSRVELDDALVVVTGAGSGIGASTARRFARAGSRVAVVDLDGERAAMTSDGICQRGGEAHPFVCDVADAEAVDALAALLADEHGAVDVLVNNAGVGVAGPFLDASLEDWEWIRSINLDGVVHGIRAFAPAMVARRSGHVVNVASGAGFVANRHMAAYCATKSAVIMLSQCLRADLASQGVGVSVICPGVIKTPIARHTRFRGSMAGKQEAAVRAFRFGHPPRDVAKAIVSAVRKDHALVPVGLESLLAFRLLRFAPGPVQGLVTKANIL